LSRREGATLYMTMMAVFQVLLSRYTGQEDVLVGTAVANRTRGETEGLIGFFVNTLVMRGDVSGNPRFVELLGRVRECALGAYAHQDVPFEKLVEEMAPTRAAGRTPLVQVAFGVQNAPVGEMELNGLQMSGMGGEAEGGRFELTVWVREGAGGEIVVRWSYDPELYGRERVERMQGHYERLLAGVVERPEAQLSALDMLTVEEKLEHAAKKQEREKSNAGKLRRVKRKISSQLTMETPHTSSATA
jgi:non-ribosomal peptide synthetase component F